VDERTARPIGKQHVLALIRKLSPDETIGDVSWFRFVPLDTGEPEALWLVADADLNRAFYGYIMAARCAGRECRWVSISYDGDNGDAVWTDVLADAGPILEAAPLRSASLRSASLRFTSSKIGIEFVFPFRSTGCS